MVGSIGEVQARSDGSKEEVVFSRELLQGLVWDNMWRGDGVEAGKVKKLATNTYMSKRPANASQKTVAGDLCERMTRIQRRDRLSSRSEVWVVNFPRIQRPSSQSSTQTVDTTDGGEITHRSGSIGKDAGLPARAKRHCAYRATARTQRLGDFARFKPERPTISSALRILLVPLLSGLFLSIVICNATSTPGNQIALGSGYLRPHNPPILASRRRSVEVVITTSQIALIARTYTQSSMPLLQQDAMNRREWRTLHNAVHPKPLLEYTMALYGGRTTNTAYKQSSTTGPFSPSHKDIVYCFFVLAVHVVLYLRSRCFALDGIWILDTHEQRKQRTTTRLSWPESIKQF
jgi:hypothetical protein